jgi:hypothetical protein
MNAWRRAYLAGWTLGARELRAADWRLRYGVAVEPFRLGYRAALAAAHGR